VNESADQENSGLASPPGIPSGHSLLILLRQPHSTEEVGVADSRDWMESQYGIGFDALASPQITDSTIQSCVQCNLDFRLEKKASNKNLKVSRVVDLSEERVTLHLRPIWKWFSH